MANINKHMPVSKVITIVLTGIAAALLIGGFFCPPMGKIDGSVLHGAAILLGFAALWVGAEAFIERGADGKITVGTGNASATVELDMDKK